MAGFSDAYENGILDLTLRGQAFAPAAGTFLSLHTADPGEDGSNEVVGGSYARQGCVWDAASGGTCVLNAAVNFATMPVGTITHFGVWNHPTAGTFVGGGTTTNRVLQAGDTYQLTTGTKWTLD